MAIKYVGILVAALCLIQVPAAVAQTSPLKVISAKRAKAYSTPTREIKARNEMEDVVLVLRLGGLSREEFQKIAPDQVYAMAGEEKLGPNVLATGVVEGKGEMLLVMVGPKALLDMTLFVGTFPKIAFKAEEAIADQLH